MIYYPLFWWNWVSIGCALGTTWHSIKQRSPKQYHRQQIENSKQHRKWLYLFVSSPDKIWRWAAGQWNKWQKQQISDAIDLFMHLDIFKPVFLHIFIPRNSKLKSNNSTIILSLENGLSTLRNKDNSDAELFIKSPTPIPNMHEDNTLIACLQCQQRLLNESESLTMEIDASLCKYVTMKCICFW